MKIKLFILFATLFQPAWAQQSLNADIKDMLGYISVLDTNTLRPLIEKLLAPKNGLNIGRLKQGADTTALAKNIGLVKSKLHFPEDSLSYPFSYNLNKEITDYAYSLELLKSEMNDLLLQQEVSVFSYSELLASYHYMCTSRSQLMAAMENLSRYVDVKRISQENLTAIDSARNQILRQISLTDEGIRDNTKKWSLITIVSAIASAILVSLMAN